jgi:hypothetical protein
MTSRSLLAFTALTSLALAACATADAADSSDLGALGKLATRSLGGSSITQIQLLASPGGRELLSHVVACALPRGQALTTIDRDGTPFAFPGALGLAPAWSQRPATALERDRITVCLRAHGLGSIRA